MRRLSSSLPRFNSQGSPAYGEKEKLGRGRWSLHDVPIVGRLRAIVARMGRKLKFRLLLGFLFLLGLWIFYHSRESRPSPDRILC